MEVTQAMCGNSTACPSCNETASIPSLSQLKRNAGETTSMDSVADQVTRLIDDRSSPFDGGCQMCSQNPASELLPTRVVFLEQRILTGSEVAVSEKGVTIGYAPTDEAWHTVFILCLFCEPCAMCRIVSQGMAKKLDQCDCVEGNADDLDRPYGNRCDSPDCYDTIRRLDGRGVYYLCDLQILDPEKS